MMSRSGGVPQNYATAATWFSVATRSGNPDAQRLLGEIYANGQGVTQNVISAHQWPSLAAANGAEGAEQLRDALAAKMTAAQIAEAHKLARDWKPR
jgi:TPR repeat protein